MCYRRALFCELLEEAVEVCAMMAVDHILPQHPDRFQRLRIGPAHMKTSCKGYACR